MYYVIGCLFALGGGFLAAIGSSTILLSLFVSIPMNKTLHRQNAIDYHAATKCSASTIITWLVLISIISAAIVIFARTAYVLGFFIGFTLETIFCCFKCGKSKENIQDYFKAYYKFINVHAIDFDELFPDESEVN